MKIIDSLVRLGKKAKNIVYTKYFPSKREIFDDLLPVFVTRSLYFNAAFFLFLIVVLFVEFNYNFLDRHLFPTSNFFAIFVKVFAFFLLFACLMWSFFCIVTKRNFQYCLSRTKTNSFKKSKKKAKAQSVFSAVLGFGKFCYQFFMFFFLYLMLFFIWATYTVWFVFSCVLIVLGTNILIDYSHPQNIYSPIVQKICQRHRVKGRGVRYSYHIRTRYFNYRFRTKKEWYDRLRVGSIVKLRIRQGFWNSPWVENEEITYI
jgi:hypothetical protein